MPSSEKHSRKDKHEKDKWHVKTLDEIKEEKKKKKDKEEKKKKSKDPEKEMEEVSRSRQRHISSGDEKIDDDEDDVLNIQPPQAKPSTHKDSRHRKDEKRKHGRSHSSDKDRKRRKRSRSAEKGKSRSKESDRVRDRDRERERERPRERERDDYHRDREKKSRKEHREDTRPAPSSVHHDESRQGEGHHSDLRQMIIDRRDDTRQVTVVAERGQQKETERRQREGKKEGEREKERRDDRHEDRHREREKREKEDKREKSRESSKQEGTKDRSRSRKDEIIEERREGSRPSSKERSSGGHHSEERGDSRSRRPDKEPQSSSSKERSPHRSSRDDKRKRDDRRKEGRESEHDSDHRRSKSKSSKSNERERWREEDEEHHQQREERKMEKEEEEEEEMEYERRHEEEEHEEENASSSEEEEEESDDEEEEDEEEESSEAESESEEEEEEVEGQEASSSEEEESAEEGEASGEELEEGEHKDTDEEEEEEEEEEGEEESEEEEESDSDSDSESEEEESGSEADQDETIKDEEKAKVKQEKEMDSSKIYVPKSKFDDDSPSPSGELRGLVEKEADEDEAMDQSDTEYLQDSPVASPVELEEKLPPYLPAIQGCRSVEEFQCLNRIAEGTYGVVYRANEKKKNDIVALKRLKMEKEKEGFPITSLREISTLLKAQHRNIVTVREIVVGSNMDKIYIVMDYVEHDLKSLMETMKQPFTIGETKCLMLQLLRGVHHLHDNWILHRDLKTSNLLLNHQGCLKIGDFGLAREYGSPIKPYTSIVVTLWYRAPELLLGTKVYSTPIDMWSVGCIFAEFLTIKPIFNGRSEIDQLNRIFKELGTPSEKIWPGYNELPAVKKTTFAHHPYNNLRNRFGTYLTDIGFELLNRFLTYDPVRRVTAEDALKHTYFTESPQPISENMFPTWPAKSEMVRTNKPRSPAAPEGGQQFAKLEKEDGDSGFRMALPTQGSSAASAGFSLKF